MKHVLTFLQHITVIPAAFRRLCVETEVSQYRRNRLRFQPPLGGCVLKQQKQINHCHLFHQPPLGGCVLKRYDYQRRLTLTRPAAFRRLCVETSAQHLPMLWRDPAAFRRLCVETQLHRARCGFRRHPAAFRRLCVETSWTFTPNLLNDPAAFRRLCVETSPLGLTAPSGLPSRL